MATKKEEPAVEATAVEESQPDGVFVLKKIDDDGNISTQVVPTGNAQPTEVQTLLELGVKSWRSQIGLA